MKNSKNNNLVPHQQTLSKYKKSNFIIFLPKGKKCNTDNVNININVNEIKQVNFTKFLGIYIDEHLSWAQHIDYLSKKIARNVTKTLSLHVHHEYVILFINIISFTVLYIVMG